MSESKFSLGAGAVLCIVSGVFLLKLGVDLRSGMLSLMNFPGIQPRDASSIIMGLAIGVIAAGSRFTATLLFSPFASHTVAETWKLMSPALRRVVRRAAVKDFDHVDLEGDLAFEALQITSMKKERHLSLKRDALGARLNISWEMQDYARKQPATRRKTETRP